MDEERERPRANKRPVKRVQGRTGPDRTIYLDAGELPPTIIYIVWGDSEDPYITQYKCSMREGRAVGVKDDGSTATALPRPKPPTFEMFSVAGNEAVRDLIVKPASQQIGGPHKRQVLADCSRIVEEGIEAVGALGHREVHDTAVREAIYEHIGTLLVDGGYITDKWDW